MKRTVFFLIFLSLCLYACTQQTQTTVSLPRADGLSEAEVETLSSLTKINQHPFYIMTYSAPYDLNTVITQEPSPVHPSSTWACSLFAAFGDPKNMVYGRNFDWEHSPAVLLYTDPPNGYASVSMVDIAYLGFSGDESQTITDLSLVERSSLLMTPFMPFDGMNEHGLVVGMAAVANDNSPPDPDKPTVDSLVMIRILLDQTKTVQEAVEQLQSYNINWGDGPALHYLIADANGQAVLAEFYRGELALTENQSPWLHATNFIRASVHGQPQGQCWRYDTLTQTLTETEGKLTTDQAQSLLQAVSQENTQWSVVYGINTGEITLRFDREEQFFQFPFSLTP